MAGVIETGATSWTETSLRVRERYRRARSTAVSEVASKARAAARNASNSKGEATIRATTEGTTPKSARVSARIGRAASGAVFSSRSRNPRSVVMELLFMHIVVNTTISPP